MTIIFPQETGSEVVVDAHTLPHTQHLSFHLIPQFTVSTESIVCPLFFLNISSYLSFVKPIKILFSSQQHLFNTS